jgi:hypothetical protein
MEAMVKIFCRDKHGSHGPLCESCVELLEYADKRLEKCPYQKDKPTCANCPIHCYKADRREQVKAVMRYSGPRMMFRHPVFALRHWIDGFKKAPPLKRRTAAGESEA